MPDNLKNHVPGAVSTGQASEKPANDVLDVESQDMPENNFVKTTSEELGAEISRSDEEGQSQKSRENMPYTERLTENDSM